MLCVLDALGGSPARLGSGTGRWQGVSGLSFCEPAALYYCTFAGDGAA